MKMVSSKTAAYYYPGTVDNLYAISKMLQVPMDSIVCGNAGRTKSQMDACLTDQERRVYTYYKKMRELNAA